MSELESDLNTDLTLVEAAKAIRMSERWVRQQIKLGEAGDGPFVEHIKRGHKILFTREQVEKLRLLHATKPPVAESMTTGKKRKSA